MQKYTQNMQDYITHTQCGPFRKPDFFLFIVTCTKVVQEVNCYTNSKTVVLSLLHCHAMDDLYPHMARPII